MRPLSKWRHTAFWGKSTLYRALKTGVRPLLWGVWALLASSLCAAAGLAEDPVLASHEAYRTRDFPALEKLAVRNSTHLLADYLSFWWIEARLGTALHLVPAAEVRSFLAHADGPLPEHLRIDWLRALAQQQEWTDLLIDGGSYAGTDPEIVCGLASARLQNGEPDHPEAARAAWLTGRSTPAGCEPVFARLIATGELGADDMLARFALALEADNMALARKLNGQLPADLAQPDESFARLAADPDGWLGRAEWHDRNTTPARQLEMYALGLIARTDSARAAALWERISPGLPAAVRARGWARIAVPAAQRLDPGALRDFRRAAEGPPRDTELEWWVRAALRASAWDDVLQATELMSGQAAAAPAWRYWRARALRASGRREEATELFVGLSHDFDFYGQLAQDEIGVRTPNGPGERPDPDEVTAMRARPGIQRALALYRLGLQAEAVQEWNFALKGLGDRQVLAAADLARQAEWYDRMISSAERAGPLADPSLLYPLPFRDSMRGQTRARGLDEAWVYGLVRQESRFLPAARSRVGATGLMQLMPATARWVARKLRLRDFKPALAQDVDINLQLGNYYLRHVLDDLGHPVLATAAYNAGPSRVRRWLEARPLEGAAFCETIPVAETRDYVKRVLANANLYASRLGLPQRSLKARLGTIRGVGALPAPDPGEWDPGFDSLPLQPTPASVPTPVPMPAPPAIAVTAPADNPDFIPADP